PTFIRFRASSRDLPVLPSFPTRRSSDLIASDVSEENCSGRPRLFSGKLFPLLISAHISFRRFRCAASPAPPYGTPACAPSPPRPDRKSTRLNSSHVKISYAVFCLKKKKR